jgi:hypothetical protein
MSTKSRFYTRDMTILRIVFSVTYYLESHNGMSIYCVSRILTTKHQTSSDTRTTD